MNAAIIVIHDVQLCGCNSSRLFVNRFYQRDATDMQALADINKYLLGNAIKKMYTENK